MNIAEMESDLLLASAQGLPALRQEVFTKLAALIEDEHDLEAILDGLLDYQEQKMAAGEVANPGFMARMAKQPWPAYLALGSLAAAPVMAGARFLMNKNAKEKAHQNLMMTAPELFGKDPARANALFELLHSSAPHLAQNTMVAKDLLTQMMSMPAIDLGTAKTMADIHQKGTGHVGAGGAFGIDVPYIAGADKNVALGKALQGKPESTKEGSVLNWNTPAMKTAGITSMFTGSGTPAQQADNATNFQTEQAGMPILPLDAIVRELMAKEQELAVRQDTIAQQEAELQQAMMAMQGVQGAYQQQYGAPPEGGMGGDQGDPAGMDQGGDPAAAGEDPAAGGDQGDQDPAASDPNATSGDQGGQDPTAGDPAAAQPPPPPATIGSTPGPSGSGSDAAAMLGMAPGQPAAPAPAPAPTPASEAGAEGDEKGNHDDAATDAQAGDQAGDPAASTDAGIEDGTSGEQELVGGTPPATTEGFPDSAGQPEATTIPAGAPVTDGNALTVTVPLPSLQISVKLAEQAAEDRMDAARALFSKTMTDIFRP